MRERSATRWGRAAALCALLLTATGAEAADGRGADGSFDQRTSAHFVLYQDVAIDESGGFRGSRRFEQGLLEELERAYDRVERFLGLRPQRKIDVVVYDPGVFDEQFRGLFKFSAAGFYNGAIAVRGNTRLTLRLSAILHHELVHAAFDAAAPSLVIPGWVNEGSAEWLEARALGVRGITGQQRAYLAGAAQQGALHPLVSLNVRAFGRFGQNAATLAYLQSHALIDYLVRTHGERRLPQFYEQLFRSRNLDRALERTFRIDSATLEARFIEDLLR